MKTQFVLPLCFAAAAHGALLFGFSRPARGARPLEPLRIYTPMIPFELNPEPPVIVESDVREPDAKPAPAVEQPPRSVEPLPAIDPGPLPTMPIPPVVPTRIGDISIVPDQLPGAPGGGGTGPWTDRPLGREFLDNAPRTRFQAAPQYPHEAKRASLTGSVLVEFLVDEQGRVHEPRVVESSDRIFEAATLRAVARWTFEPGRKDGRVVRFRMSAPVVFSLND
ncbi:energy transducer TonB [Horticoccus sp. 23ND18S-11]|uniref:energy transducer TonB n=1 Tax=Horticoccus sp. 23ND18S-11 TaxID=3391832 RepID=UPI0039C8D7B0